jgi:hypothetical protein
LVLLSPRSRMDTPPPMFKPPCSGEAAQHHVGRDIHRIEAEERIERRDGLNARLREFHRAPVVSAAADDVGVKLAFGIKVHNRIRA